MIPVAAAARLARRARVGNAALHARHEGGFVGCLSVRCEPGDGWLGPVGTERPVAWSGVARVAVVRYEARAAEIRVEAADAEDVFDALAALDLDASERLHRTWKKDVRT